MRFMARKKIEQKSEKNYGHNIWRIIAVAVILIFAVLVIGGLIKAHRIRSSFVKPTQAQITYATEIATDKLKAMIGTDVALYHVQTSQRMPIMHDGTQRTILQVTFYNTTTTHSFLIDINTGEVLLHSQTDIYEQLKGLANNDDSSRFPWGLNPPFRKD